MKLSICRGQHLKVLKDLNADELEIGFETGSSKKNKLH